MEETNQSSQTYLDFNVEKFEPKDESEIQQIIKYCFKKNLPIEIVGSQTKQGIGKKLQCAKTLNMSQFSGIIDYKPEELYITVKAGTPIKIIQEELKKLGYI